MEQSKRCYLGIDGGGTKTAFCLVSEEGRPLAEHSCGSIHLKQVEETEWLRRLREGRDTVLKIAGLSPEHLSGTFAGVPGYGEFEDVITTVRKRLPELFDGPLEIGNDCVPGWAAGTGGKPGVNMVLGTGAIAYGRNAAGEEARSSGWGPFVGDEGSAYDLGKKALALFAKEADGRLQGRILYELMARRLQLSKDFDLFARLEELHYERGAVAALASVLTEAAEAGDPHAGRAVKRAAYEAAQAIEACAAKLFKPGEPVLVSTSGGVFKAGELILAPLREALDKQEHSFRLCRPLMSPARGAALMALRAAGIAVTEKQLLHLQDNSEA